MSSAAALFVGTWAGGAVVGVGLYALSKKQFPEKCTEKTERFRALTLVGLIPCCGFNIFASVIYYVMFIGKAKFDDVRAGRTKGEFERSLGETRSGSVESRNPFGSSDRQDPPPAPEANPFGPKPTQDEGRSGDQNPFGSTSQSQSGGTSNPFGEGTTHGASSGTTENPFPD